jgi:hypothetical protein
VSNGLNPWVLKWVVPTPNPIAHYPPDWLTGGRGRGGCRGWIDSICERGRGTHGYWQVGPGSEGAHQRAKQQAKILKKIPNQRIPPNSVTPAPPPPTAAADRRRHRREPRHPGQPPLFPPPLLAVLSRPFGKETLGGPPSHLDPSRFSRRPRPC